MTTTLTGLGRIHQIAMRIHDIDRAVTFYRDALGLPFLFAAPPSLAFFDCGGVRLMLSPPSPGHDHPGSVLYFAVTHTYEHYGNLVTYMRLKNIVPPSSEPTKPGL